MSKSLKLIVEALLFASDKPLSAREIHGSLSDVKLAEIKSALEDLKQEYEEMGRSFILKDIANGYQFRSHAEYGPYILKMLQTSPNRLSRAALETLSIIAYKQPILRQEIDIVRNQSRQFRHDVLQYRPQTQFNRHNVQAGGRPNLLVRY